MRPLSELLRISLARAKLQVRHVDGFRGPIYNQFAVAVQSLSCVWLFATPWTTAHQGPLSSTISRICSNSCPLSWWYYLTISSSDDPISCCPQSFLISGSFPMSRLLSSSGQSIGASVSVLPMNMQGWFPLGWLVWSPCCPRASQESSQVPQFKRINSLVLRLLYGPNLSSVHDYWKNHSFDYMDLCRQSDVSAV